MKITKDFRLNDNRYEGGEKYKNKARHTHSIVYTMNRIICWFQRLV